MISGCCWGQAEPLSNIHRGVAVGGQNTRADRHDLNPDRHFFPDPAKVPRLLGFSWQPCQSIPQCCHGDRVQEEPGCHTPLGGLQDPHCTAALPLGSPGR